jgi:hypothetical protein
MWLLDNSTSFAADRTWVRDRDGSEVWIVAVKASFVIEATGQQVLDRDQAKVLHVPQFLGPPEASSLLHESDLVHTKPGTDVLVQGDAFSPNDREVESVDVRLRLATIDKTLRVFGDRVIKRGMVGISLSRPQPFTRMPVTYERAFGGTDDRDANPKKHRWEPRNPVGTGFGTHENHVVGALAPNVENPGVPYSGWQRGKPAGFGAIARHWAPRVALAGTYDAAWEETRRPLLPFDFDERFYQCAPEEQRIPGYLTGGERVELFNMTPDGYLSFHLPKVTLSLTTEFYDGTEVTHRAALHTLTLQPGTRRFQIVWHSALRCHQKVNKLAVTRVSVKRRMNVSERELASGTWIAD